MDDEALISAVRERPILFNKRMADFKDRNKRAAAWREVAEIAKETVDYVQKWWRLLCDRYACSKKAVVRHSGDEDGTPSPQWELMDAMNFLQGFIQHRKTETSLRPTQHTEAPAGSAMAVAALSMHIDGSAMQIEMGRETVDEAPMSSVIATYDLVPVVASSCITAPTTTASDITDEQARPSTTQDLNISTPTAGPSNRRRGTRRSLSPNVGEAFERALKIRRSEDEVFGEMFAAQLRTIKNVTGRR